MAMFNNFLVQENIIQPGMDIFRLQKLDSNIDYYIVGFIMQKYVCVFGLYHVYLT